MAARLSTPGRGGCKADSARDWKVAVGVWGVWGVQVMVAATAGDAIGVAHQQGALNLLLHAAGEAESRFGPRGRAEHKQANNPLIRRVYFSHGRYCTDTDPLSKSRCKQYASAVFMFITLPPNNPKGRLRVGYGRRTGAKRRLMLKRSRSALGE
eukprot:1194851-Prorocentrum_minimum.AAC.2